MKKPRPAKVLPIFRMPWAKIPENDIDSGGDTRQPGDYRIFYSRELIEYYGIDRYIEVPVRLIERVLDERGNPIVLWKVEVVPSGRTFTAQSSHLGRTLTPMEVIALAAR